MKSTFITCISILLLHTPVTAQNAVDTIRYVDFHIHTTMKNYYRQIKKSSLMLDSAFIRDAGVSSMNWDGDHRGGVYESLNKFSGFYGGNSYPQASYDYLRGSKASILCTSITPLEKVMVSSKDKVRLLGIDAFSMRFINRVLVTKLKMKRQKEVYASTGFDEYMGEYNFQRIQMERMNNQDQPVTLVRNRNELLAAMKANKIALVMTLEGAHILYGPKNSSHYLGPDCACENKACFDELVSNIRTIKSQEHRPFFITLSHLAWNRISGHAKGLDNAGFRRYLAFFAKSVRFREVLFNKHASGLVDTTYKYGKGKNLCVCESEPNSGNEQLGRKIIKELLDTSNNQRPLLVDMRHMDVQARIDYMKIVDSMRCMGRKIPLIVSHAAASGKNRHQALVLSSCPIVDYYQEITNPDKYYEKFRQCLNGKIPDTAKTRWLFPWGINLFDEEIANIYETDGIIGITLEERVLGKKALNYTKEHYLQLHDYLRGMGFSKADFEVVDILEPLMRNILYIVEHSGVQFKGTIKSWEHIALGTDFDGIIDPIDVCTTAKEIPQLYTYLCKYLPVFAKFINKSELLLAELYKPEELMNRLFYQNGEHFILKYYDRQL